MHSDLIIFNNKLVNAASFGLHVSNRSFKYGDGIFESIRICSKKPMFLEMHIERMQHALFMLEIKGNSNLSLENIERQIFRLIHINGISEARVRITIWREGKGNYAPEQQDCSFIIEMYEMNTVGYVLNNKGLKIDIYHKYLKPIHPLFSFKTANSLIYVMAGNYKNQNNLDDVIILNEQKRLCESTSCNLFVVQQGNVITPPLSEGPLNGVMRGQVISILSKSKYNIVERALEISDLEDADEVFFTNAVNGAQYVVGYKEKRYYSNVSRMIQEELNKMNN